MCCIEAHDLLLKIAIHSLSGGAKAVKEDPHRTATSPVVRRESLTVFKKEALP